MTDKEIMNIFRKCWFDLDDDICDNNTFYEGVYKNINLPEEEFSYATGATKAVFVMKNYDFVVKIPFNSDWGEHFCHALYGEDDYCNSEVEIYDAAEWEGVECFFLETRCIGCHHDVPFYVQEKVQEAEYVSKATKKDYKIYNSYKSTMGFRENPTVIKWIADATRWYGKKKMQKLMTFMFNEGINDIHGGNIGYRKDGAPVIIDYAGFFE